MKNIFDIANSVRATTRICTQEDFERVISSSQVASIMSQISLTPSPSKGEASPQPSPEEGGRSLTPDPSPLGEGSYREWKDKVNALKKQLPVLMPHAHFTDGRRHGQSAERSPWVSQDYDGIEDPQGFWNNRIASLAEELHIVLAFISPSGKGVKIIFQCPTPHPTSPEGEELQGEELMSIKEAQAWFAKVIGEPDYDAQTFDLARCVYLVPRKNFLYYRPSMLFGDPLPTFKVDLPHNGEALNTQGNSNSPHHGGDAKGRGGLEDAEGRGGLSLPYGQIIPEFFKLECSSFPTVPVGMRNSTIFNVTAKYLRYCTDHRFAKIKELLYPQFAFGLDEGEIDNIIKSALTRDRSLTPRKVKEILSKFTEGNSLPLPEGGGGKGGEAESLSCPQMPSALPEFIRLVTSKVPDCMKPAVASQVFPALGAHLHQFRLRYIDNKEYEAGLAGLLIGKQSIGKGCVNEPVDAINADLKKINDKNKALARQWRKESAESENDDTGLLPENIYFPLPLSNMTDAALTDRLRRAEFNGERAIFLKLDELELLSQINVGGNIKPDRIICLCYDHSEYGQERVSSNAISDSAKMRMYWIASTTPANARAFFMKNNGVMNGALSRVSICTIFPPDEEDYMPVYGIYDDDFTQKVQTYVGRLDTANGLVYCKRVNDFISGLRLWCVDKGSEYEGIEHEIWCDFYKRSLAIAFRKAMILYILSGYRWTQTMEDFIEWSLKYDLWCKFYYFSDLMVEAYQGHQCQVPVMMQGKKESKLDKLLGMLPEEFTVEDVEIKKSELNMITTAKQFIYILKKKELIEKVAKNTFKKSKK